MNGKEILKRKRQNSYSKVKVVNYRSSIDCTTCELTVNSLLKNSLNDLNEEEIRLNLSKIKKINNYQNKTDRNATNDI